MKKRKKILCLVLVAALCLGLMGVLAGCNKTPGTDDPSQPNASGEPSGSGTPSGGGSAPAPGPDTYVYTPSFVTLQEKFPSGVNPQAFIDGRFLASAYMVVRSEIPEGVTPEYEGQYDVYENRFFWIGLDGSVEPLSGYTPLVESSNDGGSYINSIQVTSDGKLLALEESYRSWYDGPDDVEMYSDEWYQKGYYNYQHWEDNYFLRVLNADGSEESHFDLKPLQEQIEAEGGYFSPYNFVATADGKLLMNADSGFLVVDREGKLEQKIEIDAGWIETLMQLPDGRLAVAYYGDSSEVMSILDPVTYQPDPEQTYPVTNVYNATPGGGDYDFYYNNGSNFMGYTLGAEKPEKVLNWINSDVDPSGLGRCYVTEDGRVVTLLTEWNETEDENGVIYSSEPTTSILILTKVPASSVARKQVLTMAVMWLDWNMQQMVVKFNRSNPDYRIEILDYSEYNTPDDYSAGQTKLNTEIMAGNLPDILNLNGISWNKLAARGFLTDLKPYLDADPELNGQIFDNVLRALESDGKLYRTAGSFMIQTVIGATSVVGDKPGWNLAKFNAALKQMPAGCEPFGLGMTRDSILSWGLGLEMDKLIDWSTGKCTFDTPRFSDILKLASQFPKDFDYSDYEWTEDDQEPNRIASGRQMLMQVGLSDFDDIQMYDAIFGGEATYIGFPTSEGVGSAISFNDEGYAISSKCRNKDAAWQFLRSLFTESYQTRNYWGFPTNRNAFQKMLDRAMTPQYMMDGNGNYILDEDGNKIEMNRGGWSWGGVMIDLKALTQEQADKVLDLIETTERTMNYDEELMQMIIADSEAFFSGQKSAEEVGRLLQSKMTIYINEQR